MLSNMHWWMIGKSGNIHHFRRVLYPYNTFFMQIHEIILIFTVCIVLVLSGDNTLPNWFTFLNLFFIPNRRVLYHYNTFLIQTHQTIFDFYRMHIIGVVVGQHPTKLVHIFKSIFHSKP